MQQEMENIRAFWIRVGAGMTRADKGTVWL